MAWLHKLNEQLRFSNDLDYGEYELENLMFELCRSGSQTGSWIRTFEVIFNGTTSDVELSFAGKLLPCARECKTIEASCQLLIDIKTEDITRFMFDKHRADAVDGFEKQFIEAMCTDTCALYGKWKKSGKLERDRKKFKIGKSRGAAADGASDAMQQLKSMQEEELMQLKDSIQDIAKQFRFQYGDNKDKKIHDYRQKVSNENARVPEIEKTEL